MGALDRNSFAAFVGRDRDLERLAELVASGARLITIRGPAGVGKTRLATQYAPAGHGAWLCDLSPAVSVADLCRAVASALEVQLPREATERIVRYLGHALAARGPSLVVLDNAEQAIAATAHVIRQWLAIAPDVQFLITSREPLALADECVFELDPLAVPPPGMTSATAVAGFAAAQLFVERARNADGAFELTDTTAPAVAEIVRQLDGLPLAIELAAAYAGVLSPAEIVVRLGKRFDLLQSTQRGAVARQQTMHAAIDWSWQLLGDAERSALAQCAVFRGGFTLGAAEAVVDCSGACRPETIKAGGAILRTLARLRDRSLVRTGDPAAPGGERRFWLYESVRDYALTRLDAGGTGELVRARHAADTITRAWDWAADPRGPRRAGDLDRVGRELDNLIAAGEWALREAGAPERARTALCAALSVHAVTSVRGPVADALVLLERSLAAAEATAPGERALIATGLAARGTAMRRLGRLAASRTDHGRAVGLARDAADRGLEATILCELSRTEADAGQIDAALGHIDAALALADAAGSRAIRAEALTARALLDRRARRLERAIATLDQVLPEARALADGRLEARILSNLCAAAIDAELADRVPLLCEEAFAAFDRLGDARSRALLETHLSVHLAKHREHERARAALECAIERFRAMGDRVHEMIAHRTLGWLEMREHGPGAGLASFENALRLLADVDVNSSDGFCHAARGMVLATRDRIDEAEAAFAAARAEMDRIDDTSHAIISLSLGHLELARCRSARRLGDTAAAARSLGAAIDRLRAARAHATENDDRMSYRLGFDAAIRLLDGAIARQRSGAGAGDAGPAATVVVSADRPPPPDALIVGDGWFRAPGHDLIDLVRRKPMRAIFDALVRERTHAPGRSLTIETLIEIGWPGERVLPEAGASRVHVAIGSLRKLGLRELLVRDHTGYLLDPAVPVADGYQRSTILAPAPVESSSLRAAARR